MFLGNIHIFFRDNITTGKKFMHGGAPVPASRTTSV